jgi:hypothetical protein
MRSTTRQVILDRFGDTIILLPRSAVIDALAARVPPGVLSLVPRPSGAALRGVHHLAAGTGPDEVPAMLARYTAARLPRAHNVVRWSRRAGTMTTWSAPPAVAFRNTAMWLAGRLPPSATIRSLVPVYGWQLPPTARPAAGGGPSR